MVYLNWIFALLGAIMVGLLKDEVSAWLPKAAQWCVRKAADQMPDRERWLEEWLAHLNECPGRLGQVFHALGVLTIAWQYKTTGKIKFHISVFRYMQSPRWALIDITANMAGILFMILFVYDYLFIGETNILYLLVITVLLLTSYWTGHKFNKAYEFDKFVISHITAIAERRNI